MIKITEHTRDRYKRMMKILQNALMISFNTIKARISTMVETATRLKKNKKKKKIDKDYIVDDFIPATAVLILQYTMQRRDDEEPKGVDKDFTVKEICDETGLHKSSYKKAVKILYSKGWIEKKIKRGHPTSVEWKCSEATEN